MSKASSKRPKKQLRHPSQFRSTWLAPLSALVLIAAISIGSYIAQSVSAASSAKKADEEKSTAAAATVSASFKDLGEVSSQAARLYSSDKNAFQSSVSAYVDQIKLREDFPGASFIGFLPGTSDYNSDDEQLSFLESGKKDFDKEKANNAISDLLVASTDQSRDITSEIKDSITSGEYTVSAPFSIDALSDGPARHVVLTHPVYEGEPSQYSKEERVKKYKGSIIIPVALEPLIQAAQESTASFRILRLLDSEKNIIASSDKNLDVTGLQLDTKTLDVQGQKFLLEYDNFTYDSSQLSSARRTTLFMGLGLAIIVFLFFAMIRVSEGRTSRLAEHAEREIFESEARFSALIERSSDITLVLDSEYKISFASPSVYSLLGYSNEEIIGKGVLDIASVESTRKTANDVALRLKHSVPVDPFEAVVLAKDGQEKTFECVINDLRNDDAVQGIVVNSRDITERKHAEVQAAKAKALYENALANAPIGVALVHQDGECFFSNDALQEFLGREESDVNELRLRDFISADDQFSFSDMWQTLELRGTDRTTKELRFDHPDGRQRWGNIYAQGVYDDDVFQYYVVQVEDTTERRSIAERLEYQAIHDPLTGLPNRLLFVDRLEVSLQRSKRTGLAVAVLFLDLDRFKVVNDSLGHAAGDRLLETVTERIKASVRPNDTIARFGGDEFVVLCEDISDERQTQEISDRLLENINRPIMLLEGEVYVTASIGIARSLSGEDTPETILRDADTAMYRAKDAGRNRAEIFDERTHARAVANLETGNGMFRALSANEFRMRYQPIISLASGRLSGFEALVYWEHPERGHVGPIDFIALAEETGVIVPLGLRIFEEACETLHRWHKFSPQASHLTMSINLSPRQLAEPTFVEEIRKSLERTKVNPARIWFEITETALMVDADSTIAMLEQLCSLGVHFEVDDFGTGFSSLSYLKKFPVDALKIDQGFVDGLGRDPEDTAIVTAVVSLSHALGLQAIAEGVETPLQMAELKTLGCEYAQGYLFARPAHAEDWDDSVRSDELFTFAELPSE